VCALFCTVASNSARAADPDAWRHPDPRFASIDDAVDDDDYAGAQQLLAELRTEAKRGQDQALLAEALEAAVPKAIVVAKGGKTPPVEPAVDETEEDDDGES
jgi:hypothetical protein